MKEKSCPICGNHIPTDLLGEPQLKPTQRFIAAYYDAWLERWKTKPIISGAEAGCASRIVKDVGLENAIALMHSYLKMNDTYFLTRRHSIRTMSDNLGKVKIFHDTGSQMTQREIHQVDRRQTNANAFLEILEDERDQ